MRDDILAELAEAEAGAAPLKVEGCPLCDAIRRLEPGPVREALTRAAGGTIGIARLVAILRKNDIQVGRVFLARHREQEHRP